MSIIKLCIKVLIRFLLRIVSLFIPIKKRQICFESFDGRQISCNPYYIYQELLTNYPFLDFIWIYNKNYNDNIKWVKRGTWKYVYTLMTSNVYITNDDIPLYVPFRKKQIVINTWHGGGAYKRVGTALQKRFSTRLHFKIYNNSISWFISNNQVFTDIISESFLVDKQKFLPFGQPRNDILFDSEKVKCLNAKVREHLFISDTDFIILYAPTYRSFDNKVFDSDMQLDLIMDAVNKRFGCKCVMFVRGHHGLSTVNLRNNNLEVLNVSDYQDMQELLCAADMLISDYSSCIWDYSFLYRPCFLYTQDLSDYKDSQNFYTPIESWGFPVAKTSEELVEAINLFDANDFKQRMYHHHNELGSYENGSATKRITDLIMSHINYL